MKATAYYNEIDPYAAKWLENLIEAGHIAPGVVDSRSITEVKPDDLHGFTQCHFFSGIGVWSYALRLAGWPDTRPVWTGSCPCQPFSTAGKGKGRDDERHLWPAWADLIRECRPATIFGEQVASPDALDWFDHVQTDLEISGYACGAADLCAAGIGAPHIRQRLWFVAERVADADNIGQPGPGKVGRPRDSTTSENREVRRTIDDGGGLQLADTECARLEGWRSAKRGEFYKDGQTTSCGAASEFSGRVADTDNIGRDKGRASQPQARSNGTVRNSAIDDPGPTNGHWRDADWLFCRDGKWRPVEPLTFPLAHGASSRVGRLRGYGNAICPQVAEQFIRAAM